MKASEGGPVSRSTDKQQSCVTGDQAVKLGRLLGISGFHFSWDLTGHKVSAN